MATQIPYLKVKQGDLSFYLASLPARILSEISYASVRGKDQEEGAVQRILSTRRINSIKDYALTVGHFPTCVVLNWVSKEQTLSAKGGKLVIPVASRLAQLIDGQHRVAGLRAAIEENSDAGKLEIPVAIYKNLSTQECASIFLSINTEQKPVPRSLVFDLYGVADQNIIDPAAFRARDIATAINTDEGSPYEGLIKFPGSPRRKGGIALSTAVSAIKPLVEEKGDFEQRGIFELEIQTKILLNWFSVLKAAYGKEWYENSNAFMFASGFTAAIEFLRTKLLTACQDKKSFTRDTMESMFNFDYADLIKQDEVKGRGGKEAPQVIQDRLNEFFIPPSAGSSSFEV